ncbi:hypothetical protein, partial [Tepidimonas sp.]|uniref:hypothetical protein n=1 Tax=Tepidimonas sp. TaxID=2002775 RepID=UPI00391D950F
QPSTGPAPEADDPAHQPPGPMISASDVKAREDELAERMAKQRVEAERRAHMSDEARAFVASGKPIVAPTKDGNFIAYLPSKIVYNTAATPQDGFAFGDTPDEAVAILEAKQNS